MRSNTLLCLLLTLFGANLSGGQLAHAQQSGFAMPPEVALRPAAPPVSPAPPAGSPQFAPHQPAAANSPAAANPQIAPAPPAAVVRASFSDAAGGADGNPGLAVTRDAIATELTAVEAATHLGEDVRKECSDRLNKAKEWLDIEDASKKRQTEMEAFLAKLPETLAQARADLAAPVEAEPAGPPGEATIAELETQLTGLRQQVELDEKELQAKEREIEGRTGRLADLTKEIAELEKRIAESRKQLGGLPTDDVVARTQMFEQHARFASMKQQLVTAKLERRRVEEVGPLRPLQRDLANRTLNARKKQLASWQTKVDTWRKSESKRQAAEARRIANESHPALKSLAEQNALIAEGRIATAAGIERIGKIIEKLNQDSKRFQEEFEALKSKVEHAGATSTTGLLLRKQRSELPEPAEFAARAALVHAESPASHLQSIEWKQMRREVADPAEAADQVANQVIASLGEAAGESQVNYDRSQVLEVVTRLYTDRLELLDKADADQDTLLRKWNELELVNQAFETQVADFREYLNQRVLWIRSADAMSSTDLHAASTAFLSLLTPSSWTELIRVGCGDLLRRPVMGVSLISFFVLVVIFRARLLALQQRLSQPPLPGNPANFIRYAAAFAIAIFMSARWPALLLAVGCRLQMAAGATTWTHTVGEACCTTVLFVWACEWMREVCRRDSVGEKVFGWSREALATVRHTLDLTLLVGTPLFLMLQVAQYDELAEMRSLQRLLFICILAFVGVQIGWLVRPGGQLMSGLRRESATSLVYRLRHPIWFTVTGAPITFAILSLVGFHFSAYQLSGRLAETGVALVGIIVLHSLSLCWLQVKAFNRKWHERVSHEAAEQAASVDLSVNAAETVGVSEDETPPMRQRPAVSLEDAADNEFRDLLRWGSVILLVCGGWVIWSDVLPALRVLDRVELWQNIESIAETVLDKEGKETIRVTDRPVPTTLTDVFAAVLVFIATLLIGRRLPSVLELMVLDRLPMEPGTRQAVAILVRYVSTLVGLLFACHIIRLSWGSVQWLAAAMTVGLGFGLQEIFANLVSGLIILFERPIRVGDLVTVGDLTGNVTRMQMRATTITDFDRREMIVPNKKFITDNVINWTLTDPVSRVVLPVGVAYGSDVRLVQRILQRIADECPLVMREPEPSTLFKSFGDSTLNMELRVFIARRDLYPVVVNELNGAIVTQFKKANIEIAFPQRDLHIKSVETLQQILPAEAKSKVA